ncbi:4Fe-4S dicluster domain-containing protein [candidate division KSB1 bacterium]|nr:4Fe-4S dicluster domain-containing protein [candidate division KSB1 bacterium]
MIIKVDEFIAFLYKCQDKGFSGFDQIILPVRSGNKDSDSFYFAQLSKSKEFDIDSYRTVDPLKMFFFLPREKILPQTFDNTKRLIVGAKGCDIRALKVLDKAMINEDFVDPAYFYWRQNTTIISADCTDIAPTCHCNLVDGHPYAEANFDLNLSRYKDVYVVTSGSEKGEELLELLKKECKVEPGSPEISANIQEQRNKIIRLLEKQNEQYERNNEFEKLKQNPMDNWSDESKTCIGCGACTNICPTCYCLILNDETKAEEFVKVRSMDSCQLNGYARVAGGSTPRPKMFQRFRNRYLCKFLFMKSNFDMLGCTGCGRCTEACAAQIDFRQVVNSVLNAVVD